MLKLAYFSPLPPAATGIADYSALLLPELAKRVEITLYVDHPAEVDPLWGQQFAVRPTSAYPAKRWQTHLPLYHIGNNASFHIPTYELAVHYGGVVVLHDYHLHMMLAEQWIHREGNYGRYAQALGYTAGAEGYAEAVNIWYQHQGHDFAKPLNGRLLDSSLAVITHSHYTRTLIAENHPHQKIATIPMAVSNAYPLDPAAYRAKLGLTPEQLVVGCAGLVAKPKQIELALRAFAQLHQQLPTAHFLVIGQALPEVHLPQLMAELQLETAVTLLGRTEPADFINWMNCVDVLFNLRYPTIGETSLTALQGMLLGKVVLVFQHGWYAELPTGAVVHLPVMDEEAAVAQLLTLAHSSELRAQIGAEAQAYCAKNCQPAGVALAYQTFLQSL